MDTAIAPATLSYLTALSLVSTPLPQTSLSSSASQSLSSLLPSGLTPALLATKCGRCRAEIVGGINGSYWMEGGSLWAYCEGCGWSSRRVGTTAGLSVGDGQGGAIQGKSAFGRVKRRRIEERSLVAAEGRLEQAMARGRGESATNTPTSLSGPPTRSGTPSYSPISTSPAPPATPTPPREAASAGPSTAPVRPAPEQRPPAPSPAVSSSITATPAKKKKRAKQPGLAELLATKKRENAKAAGGGVALSDFLEGMG